MKCTDSSPDHGYKNFEGILSGSEFDRWLADRDSVIRADAAKQIEETLEREGFPSRVRAVVRAMGREFLLDSPNARGMT